MKKRYSHPMPKVRYMLSRIVKSVKSYYLKLIQLEEVKKLSLFVTVIHICTSPYKEIRYYRIDDLTDTYQLKGSKWLYSMTI